MSTKYGGYANKALKINLSTKEVSEYPISDEYRKLYLGGKILACKIIDDMISAPIDPLSEENIIVISTGPLSGAGSPSSSRFNISTISPLTNLYTSSNCGGNFGMQLKKAGYDVLVITGKSKEKIKLEVLENSTVNFVDASDLWGKTTGETQEALPRGGKLVIGPAGENMVKYACVINEERAAGRGGVGAVFGSKNLKAIFTTGKTMYNAFNKEKLQAINKKWVKRLQDHPLTGEIMPKLGTSNLVKPMQKRGLLATKNFQNGQFDGWEKISGETMAQDHLIKNKGCLTCPIQCARVVEVDGKQVKGPELETLGLLGANLLNDNLPLIFKWNYILDEMGMDTMSFGGSIAFAMELKEKGLADLGVEFGKTDNIEALIKDIAYRKGNGTILADGVRAMSEKYGGKDFALHSKGLELAAYEPRSAYGQGLGYAVANRGGCHLNAGYLVVLEGLGLDLTGRSALGKAGFTIMFQNLMEAVSAAGSCLFTTYAFFPIPIMNPKSFVRKFIDKIGHSVGFIVGFSMKAPKLLAVNLPTMLPHPIALSAATGMKLNMGKLLDIGKRGYNLERTLNCRLGVNKSSDSLPKRLTDEAQPEFGGKVPLDKLKKSYYFLRGWDKNGVPKKI